MNYTDTLTTRLATAGAAAYRTGMAQASASVGGLGNAALRAAAQEAVLAAGMGGTAAAATGLAAAEGEATLATLMLEAAGGPVALALAGVSLAAGGAAIALGSLTLAAGAAAAATVAAMRASAAAAADFQTAMKEVEVQSGATRDAMNSLRGGALSGEMVRLGKSALDVAGAYTILASMGYSAAQMQAMMLPITQASVALGTDQAETTQLMIALMKQYNLTAADMPRIADQLVAGLAATSMQGEQVVMVMKYAGVAASSLGWSLGETIAAVDPLVAAFGNAEMAGTYFRQMLNVMKSGSKEAADAFASAGLNLNDFSKYSGSAATMLRWLQSGTWDASKITKAFGGEAGSAAQVLLQQSIPAMEAVAAKTQLVGAATDAANAKMQTLQGMQKRLAAAWTNLKISVGTSMLGMAAKWTEAVGLIVQAAQRMAELVNKALGKTQKDHEKTGSSAYDMADRLIQAFFNVGVAIISFSAKVAPAIQIVATMIGAWARGISIVVTGLSLMFRAFDALRGLDGPSALTRSLQLAAEALDSVTDANTAVMNDMKKWQDMGAIMAMSAWMVTIGNLRMSLAKLKTEAKTTTAPGGGNTPRGAGPNPDGMGSPDDYQAADAARQKAARDMERLGERAIALGRAVQMVIGGRLSEQVKAQLDRLSGADLNGGKGYLRGVRPNGDNKIVLELRYPTNVTPQERAQTTGWLLDAIRDAGRRAPVGG